MYMRFYPHGLPYPGRHDEDHDYERYREAWDQLSKTPRELSQHKKVKSNQSQRKRIPRRKPGRPPKRRRHPERSRIGRPPALSRGRTKRDRAKDLPASAHKIEQ